MLVFGGAGADNGLHDDTWCLELSGRCNVQGGGRSRLWTCYDAGWWQSEEALGQPAPSARSSFVLAPWTALECAVLHGGIGNEGVMSDVWMLQSRGEWIELPTSGSPVSRAHHCGAVHGDYLLVHSGQDATFLTSRSIQSLDLRTGNWLELAAPHVGPASRIDASAASIEGVGLLIFGGVNTTFDFSANDMWMLKVHGATVGAQRMAAPMSAKKGPRPHACGGLCTEGLRAYSFGGFDGQHDSDELWCLSLLAPPLENNRL